MIQPRATVHSRTADPRRARLMSWAMSGIWLVFLYFPIRSLLHDHPANAFWGLSLMACFVVAYLALLRTLGIHLPPSKYPLQSGLFASLVAITLLSMLVDPDFALVYLPFLVAAAGFGLWTPVNRIVSSATLVITSAAALLLAPRNQANSMLIFGVLNLLISWAITSSIERGQREAALREENLVMEERNRIAGDVHDLLGHSLTVVNLKLQLVHRLIDADPARARLELDETRAIVAEALGNVRRTVSMERSSGLADELEQARNALQGNGVELVVDGNPAVPTGPMALVLGWVLRESVTNALRHAHASRVQVSIAPRRLVVEDDGDGLTGTPHDGNGLRGMHERVAAAGGEVRVGHGELGGVKVEVTW